MSGTYTKDVIKKNQNAIVREYGKRKFYDAVRNYGTAWYSSYGREFKRFIPSQGVMKLLTNEPIHSYTEDRYAYLKRTIPNFNPKIYLCKTEYMIDKYGVDIGNNVYVNSDKVDQVYLGIMVRDGVKLFEQIEKEHPDW